MYYIGIDIGGTNMVAGVVDSGGRLVQKKSVPVDRAKDADGIIEDLISLSCQVCDEADIDRGTIKALGIGLPGQVDNDTGVIIRTVNMPFHNTPLRNRFQMTWDVPIFLANDAHCAALGEYWAGAAKGCDPVVVITLGTGIGGGIISAGRLFVGFAGSGLEVGHMITHAGGLLCTCGNRGCWEQYGSAPALIRQTREAMRHHPDSKLWEFCGGDPNRLEGRTTFDCAATGDATALEVLDMYRHHVAAGLINIVNILQPEILCLSGGISNAADELLLNPIREMVLEGSYDKLHPTRITRAALGNDAGVIGAALLYRSI